MPWWPITNSAVQNLTYWLGWRQSVWALICSARWWTRQSCKQSRDLGAGQMCHKEITCLKSLLVWQQHEHAGGGKCWFSDGDSYTMRHTHPVVRWCEQYHLWIVSPKLWAMPLTYNDAADVYFWQSGRNVSYRVYHQTPLIKKKEKKTVALIAHWLHTLHLHTAQRCALSTDSRQMLRVWTPCRTNTTPRTWLAPRSRLTFPPFCLKLLDVTQYTKRVFLLLFQLATRSYKSDNTNCVALFLTFAGKRVRSGSTPKIPTVSFSGRQLRSLIES